MPTQDNTKADYALNTSESIAKYPDLKDKTVVISGGGSGIGSSLVTHFCQQQADVYFCSLSPETAEQVVEYAERETGVKPTFKAVDLTNVDKAQDWLQSVIDQTGEIYCLINNAGNDKARPFLDTDIDFLRNCFDVNFQHQYVLGQIAARKMSQQGYGNIINMGSISWMIGAPGVTAYTAMKAAIAGLTNSMAKELGPHKVRVNSILPGWILTQKQLQKGAKSPEKFDDYLSRQAWKEHLDSADIARLALWLASDEAKRMSGQNIVFDGGIVT